MDHWHLAYSSPYQIFMDCVPDKSWFLRAQQWMKKQKPLHVTGEWMNERMNELDEWMNLPPVVRRLGQCTLNFPLIYLSGNFFKFSHLIFQINVKFVFYAEWPTCPVLLGTFLVFPLKVSYPRKTFSSGQTGTAGHPNSSPYYLHD